MFTSVLFIILVIRENQVGGVEEVQLAKVDFDFAKAATKPTVMALRLVDKLFSKEVLMNSTVHGTKDFAPLDHRIITVIKGTANNIRSVFILEYSIETFSNV